MKNILNNKYSNYANYVNENRAVPSVYDGLKPVQRRILYIMNSEKISKFTKSAKITGVILGRVHPHGDSSVYQAMVNMSQSFNNAIPYIEGQGNFGSIYGDSAASMRYTECKLSEFSEDWLLSELKHNVHDTTPNYDDSETEPVALPVRVCNYLLHGNFGIGVGTDFKVNIPPHNLKELCQTTIKFIENLKTNKPNTVKDLLKILKGPDYPTGGVITTTEEDLLNIYSSGNGKFKLSGVIEINEPAKEVAIVQIPYQTTTDNLIENLSKKINEGSLVNIADVIDKSKVSINICIKSKIKDLYKLRDELLTSILTNTISVRFRSVEFEKLDLITILDEFVKYRVSIITRITEKEKQSIENRLHLLEGLIIILADIKKVVDIILKSDAPEEDIKKKYKLTDIQVEYIMNTRLKQLKQLEIETVKKEQSLLNDLLNTKNELLNSKNKIYDLIINDHSDILKKYKNIKRNTKIQLT